MSPTPVFLPRRLFLGTALLCTMAGAVWLTMAWGDSVTTWGKVFYLAVFAPCLLGVAGTLAFLVAALWAIGRRLIGQRRVVECGETPWPRESERGIISLALGNSGATVAVLQPEGQLQALFALVGGPLVAWYCVGGTLALAVYVTCEWMARRRSQLRLEMLTGGIPKC